MRPARPTLAHLDLADDPDRWASLGWFVDDGCTRIGSVELRFVEPDDGRTGLVGWALSGLSISATELDGVPTTPLDDTPPEPAHPTRHANGAEVIDHVVLRSPDIDRTLAALADAGLELRRLREVPDSPLHQAFYRVGETILEVVGEPGRHDDAPSTLWGLVCTVADEPRASEVLGDSLGTWRDAVQPGRRIATVRRSAGLSTAVALMTR
ncbi:MAG: glyoxalase [Actinomycetota bacterium]